MAKFFVDIQFTFFNLFHENFSVLVLFINNLHFRIYAAYNAFCMEGYDLPDRFGSIGMIAQIVCDRPGSISLWSIILSTVWKDQADRIETRLNKLINKSNHFFKFKTLFPIRQTFPQPFQKSLHVVQESCQSILQCSMGILQYSAHARKHSGWLKNNLAVEILIMYLVWNKLNTKFHICKGDNFLNSVIIILLYPSTLHHQMPHLNPQA